MKIKQLLVFTLLISAFFSANAAQDIVKTMPLDSAINQSGTVRLVLRLTDDATGPDIGVSLHQAEPAAPWDDAMAICMFDFIKNTNGGIHLAGYNAGAWDWHEKVKAVEKNRMIALWLTVDAVNNTHALAAQMQGESGVTTIYTGYGDRASLKGKPNASAGFCSVFVNNKDGQQTSAIEIIEDAIIVDAIAPYDFEDSTCFTSYGDIIYADITEGDAYEFGGASLTIAGVYYDTIMNVQGCDSILTLNLTVSPAGEKAVILAQLQKVNNYYMINNPETETVNSGASKWLEGSYFNGHTALFQLHPTRENMRYAMQWGQNNSWNIGNTKGEADNQCVGQVYMDLYYANGAMNDDMLAKVGASVSAMVARSTATDDWDWIDALYMAMPTLTRYGIWTGDGTYFDKLYEMYHSTKVTQQLYNSSDSLWYRDGAVLSGKKYKCYWARGNGWVFGAHVRTLMYLPEDDAHRQEYIDTYKAMAYKLKKLQRTDGFWNACLDDDTYYPGPETSGTAFFVYGMAWGINNGFLDKDTYLPVVMKGWNALVETALDTDGRIGYVQGVADEPKDDQPVTLSKSREYGYGNFLLAGTEVVHLVEGDLPVPELFYVKNVEMEGDAMLKVNFFEPVEKTSAELIANYTVNKNVNVESALVSTDSMSVVLTLSGLQKGGYAISFAHIQSISGKTIEEASGQFFMVENDDITTLRSDNMDAHDLLVYPNPTNNGYFEFETSVRGRVEVSLIDLSGKVLISESINNTNSKLHHTMNVSHLAKGLYVLNVSGSTQIIMIE